MILNIRVPDRICSKEIWGSRLPLQNIVTKIQAPNSHTQWMLPRHAATKIFERPKAFALLDHCFSASSTSSCCHMVIRFRLLLPAFSQFDIDLLSNILPVFTQICAW
jgi:hypothetical protein